MPEQAGEEKAEEEEKEEEEEEEKGWHAARRTRGSFSPHSREFCTASAYRNLRREHRSGRRPQDTSLSRTPRVGSLPRRRTTTVLFLFHPPLVCFASPLLLPFAITDIVLLTRFPFSFFLPESGPNWWRPGVHCVLVFLRGFDGG